MSDTVRVHTPVDISMNPWLKHDPELANRFSCDICGKTFASEFDFKYHRRLNHEKTFECPLCPEKFKRRQNVEAHLSKFLFHFLVIWTHAFSHARFLSVENTTDLPYVSGFELLQSIMVSFSSFIPENDVKYFNRSNHLMSILVKND